ncbi:replication initiation protein [Clostridium beijerinckii]|uniref:replication initiation protein n=1 Tax=Clostridium beijerinckii TaxID=1520 RepID=UPI00156F7B0E|nr:replication initiation protein [Clostridium beijerinckii]NRU52530.1 plasmid replication initiation protein [Clostridium beijerinckii]NYC69409.1 plasmid replication initiation protein [Clostridium beijerinckii]NYC91731.1 plasmid replication initiation protein [Clostridium beijerinckii]
MGKEHQEKVYEQLALNIQPMETDTYVYKSHNLIESGYNFTLNEQRLTYLASKKLKPRYIKSNIKPSQMKTFLANETFKDLRIYVNEFKDAFDLKSNNLYKVLADTAHSLKQKNIQYLQDDGVFVEKSWVITSKYNPEGKYVDLTFHPDLILDLLVIKGRFGKMEYNATKKFTTSYAFRIYELLQNYAYRGFRRFELEDLRYKLGIYDDNKYKQFSDFKKYILNPSIESINQSTSLDINFKELRYGRKVGAIEFYISQKTLISQKIDDDIDVVDQSQVEEMEKRVGCTLTAGTVATLTNMAIESIKKHKIDMSFYQYIEYEMERVREYSKQTTIKNVVSCLKTALRENWGEEISIPKNSDFNNFDGRDYNYDALEEMALGYKDYNPDELYNK